MQTLRGILSEGCAGSVRGCARALKILICAGKFLFSQKQEELLFGEKERCSRLVCAILCCLCRGDETTRFETPQEGVCCRHGGH